MGLSQSTVSRIISGQMKLTVEHLYAFAEALEIPVKELLIE